MHILSKARVHKFIRLGKPKKSAGGQILIFPTVYIYIPLIHSVLITVSSFFRRHFFHTSCNYHKPFDVDL